MASMDILFIDEFSMLDVDLWSVIEKCMKALDAIRGRSKPGADAFGSTHMILCGDLKQLPPATSKAPFIVKAVRQGFDFRVLRQNRRLRAGCDETRFEEFEQFHGILDDVSHGRDTPRVRNFFVEAYVRAARHTGAPVTGETTEFEGSVAVLTKRRYRDKWNRKVCTRVGKMHAHSLKVRAQMHAAHARGQWYTARKGRVIRRLVRPQAPQLLHLAGDWQDDAAEDTGIYRYQ